MLKQHSCGEATMRSNRWRESSVISEMDASRFLFVSRKQIDCLVLTFHSSLERTSYTLPSENTPTTSAKVARRISTQPTARVCQRAVCGAYCMTQLWYQQHIVAVSNKNSAGNDWLDLFAGVRIVGTRFLACSLASSSYHSLTYFSVGWICSRQQPTAMTIADSSDDEDDVMMSHRMTFSVFEQYQAQYHIDPRCSNFSTVYRTVQYDTIQLLPDIDHNQPSWLSLAEWNFIRDIDPRKQIEFGRIDCIAHVQCHTIWDCCFVAVYCQHTTNNTKRRVLYSV